MKILQVGLLVVFLALRRISGRPSWRDVGRCGSGLDCGPECQKLCLTQHNYYRALHNLSPVRCDADLAESAQAWTDLQAQKSHIKRSPWRNLGQVAESISWKQWGWEGMAETRGAVPGAVRSWYSEKKGNVMNRTVTSEHYQTIVRPDITRLGCGIHVIPGDGTYVTSHYGTMPGGNVLNDEIQIPAARDPEPACQVKSGQREKCGNISSPYMTPDVCLKAGCCYDDIFRDEPDVNWYSSEGSTWCYKRKNNEKEDQGEQTAKINDLETQNIDDNETNVNASMVTETNDLENQNSLDDNGEPKGFFKDCLDQHNKLRAKHGVPPLKWSKKLAANALKTAKMNANLGRMKHDPDNKNEGENIAYFGPPQPKCEGPKVGNCFQCREVVDDWYSEIKDYDFAAGKSKNGGVVLHFTQVVWRKTTEMGMATAVGNNKVFSVARYSEKGNMLPEDNFVKNVPPLGSAPSPTSQPESTGSNTGSAATPTPQPSTGAVTSAVTTSAGFTSPGPTSESSTTDMEAEAGNDCYGSSCYSFNGEGKKWTENRETCKKRGGDLVSMETEGEWSFLKDKIQGLTNQLRDEWHIGLTKEGSSWKWVNGDPLTITHWQRGEPSGDGPYVVMAKNYPPGTQGGLNDLPDWIPSGYICETKNTGANTSPTVPSGVTTPQPPSGAVTSATSGATSGATTGASTSGQTSSAEPTGFFKDCLDQHNKLRAKHGIPPLKWSKKLASNALKTAKMNANLGRMKHDPDNKNEGENIAYFGPPQPKCEGPKTGNCFQCREVVDDWYSEIKDYDFAAGKSKNGGVVLHFTQVVWRKTTEMGMATAVGNNKVFSVARYSEKGNMLPEDNFVKNVPPLI